ncbi:hypothetical protein WJX81_008355 [Elliptochloris bilobata]|uniref:type I protein arginine methyltransferase n=1 Tax=Elliptochloris bilobata TaxID=381761 RepID=A0AAW1RLY1_9CHLO
MVGNGTEGTSSAHEEEEEEGDDMWEDWQAEGGDRDGEEATQSLFDGTLLPSVAAALDYDAEKHGVDLRKLRIEKGLDDYSMIACINFTRTEVAAGRDPRPALASTTQGFPWAGDRYLQPVLPDDPLLCHDWQDEAGPSGSADAAGAAELAALRDENEALRDALRRLSLAAAPAEVTSRLQVGPNGSVGWADEALDPNGAPPPIAPAAPERAALFAARRPGARALRSAAAEAAEASYFDSYGYIDIHRTMLADKVRTEAYRRALEGNPDLMRGATVLDVGCGTGILSMFAARAGAARVIAVEGSERMAAKARAIISANRLYKAVGGPIEVVVGRLEDLQNLPVDKVDVIVSEWMGYALFFEAMLDTVLHARDRWLRPGGALLPDRVALHLAAASEGALDLAFWEDVQGFSYAPVREALHADALSKALVAPVAPDDLLSAAACVATFDLGTMAPADADFTTSFELRSKPMQPGDAQVPPETAGADSQARVCHALVLWFDADFSARVCAAAPISLRSLVSTSRRPAWLSNCLQAPARGVVKTAATRWNAALKRKEAVMKYAQYLHALERDAPRHWRGKFLKYKEHKKQIKAYKDRLAAVDKLGDAGAAARVSQLEHAFFNRLFDDVVDVNFEFERAARALLRMQGRRHSPPGCLCQVLARMCGVHVPARAPGLKPSAKDEALEQQAAWCRRFAQINAVGLRKILKKHDKLCSSKVGQDFLQSLWNGGRRAHGSFLHSPLLDELRAMEAILARDNAAAAEAALAAVAAARAVHPSAENALMDDPSSHRPARALPERPSTVEEGGADEMEKDVDGATGGVALGGRLTLPLLASLAGGTPVVIEEESEAGDALPSIEQPEAAADPALPAAPAAPVPPRSTSRPIPIARSSGQGVVAFGMAGSGRGMAGSGGERGGSELSGSAAGSAGGMEMEMTSVSLASSGMGPPEEVDEDYLCPICLDIMYKPIGLECGHKFCADCAFTAVGKGNALGSVRAILYHVSAEAACPECRSVGMFVLAHELHQTEQLLRKRWPEEYAKRAKELQAKEARLRSILARQRAQQKQEQSFRPAF